MSDQEDARERALARAGRALAQRPRSEAEIRRRLAGVAPAAVCEGVIADLGRLGYLDDAALARSLAERRLADGWGAARVEWDLARLGIEGEPALEAVALARQGESEAARELVERRGLWQ